MPVGRAIATIGGAAGDVDDPPAAMLAVKGAASIGHRFATPYAIGIVCRDGPWSGVVTGFKRGAALAVIQSSAIDRAASVARSAMPHFSMFGRASLAR